MKKFGSILGALLGALLLVSPAWADGFGSKVQLADGVLADNSDLVVSQTGATFVGGDISFTANSQSIVIDTKSIGGVSLTLTGTWSATLQVQWSNKSSSGFTAGQVRDINAGTTATSITANGNYSAAAGGRYLKLTTTAYTSGTIVVTPVFKNAGYASAVTGEGGGFVLPYTATCPASGTCFQLKTSTGTTVFSVTAGDVFAGSNSFTTNFLNFGGKTSLLSGSDGNLRIANSSAVNFAWLAVDGANLLSLRNGVNPQTFRIYNTYTDPSNGEWAELTWLSNVVYLRPEANGTGTSRLLVVVGGSTTVVGLPSCAAETKGARSFVTDANSTTFLAAAAGGGANNVPVVCDGTSWKIG